MLIKIHIYLFLMVAYMYATKKLKLFLWYYLFLILHELAHIIVALMLKVRVVGVTLLPVGVNAKYIGKISNIKEIIISLAGPLASFLFFIFLKEETLKNINLVICLFNLIPIFPFDGGRIIKNIFVLKFRNEQGIEIHKSSVTYFFNYTYNNNFIYRNVL